MTAVVFDYSEWAAAYPLEAAYTTQPVAENYFLIATGLLDNTDGSPVPYDPAATPPVLIRKNALYLLVSHIAVLNSPARASTGLVGRISSASEGSVSVQTSLNVKSGTAEYYAQTPWGLLFWQMTSAYRRGFYAPGPQEYRQPRPYRA